MLVGVDEETALVRTGAGPWDVIGAGDVTVYRDGATPKTASTSRPTSTVAEAPALRLA